MVRAIKIAAVIAVLSMIGSASPLWAYWAFDGLSLSTEGLGAYSSVVTSDGAGGAVVVWEEFRGVGSCDIYAQRLNAIGVVQWAPGGVLLCRAETQMEPSISSDGAGGAIIAWSDDRNGNFDIYAQRVNGSGVAQWGPDGMALCTASFDQFNPVIASDGAGGVIITWYDSRSGSDYDIYAQRVNGLGVPQWTPQGVAVCGAAGDQEDPVIVSDGAGGVIIGWYDTRNGNDDIYAQRVNGLGSTLWNPNGVAICTAPGDQWFPTITVDGGGGAIVAWGDGRNGNNSDIYAQRVNGSGVAQWTANGVAVYTGAGDQLWPQIVPDGAGGTIIAWEDYRNGNEYDVYAQRVNVSGAVQWSPDGVALCTANGSQENQVIVSDGAGGVIAVWEDARNGNFDIYSQRVNSSGVPQWTPNGVTLCTAPGDQQSVTITSDGAHGAIAVWEDFRTVEEGGAIYIYAQVVDGSGRVPTAAPSIYSVRDIPADQGGWLRITVEHSPWDDKLATYYPLSLYNVWQRVNGPGLLPLSITDGTGAANGAHATAPHLKLAAVTLSASGWPIHESNGHYTVHSEGILGAQQFPPGTWELVGSFAGCRQDQYLCPTSTLADSTRSGIPYSVYVVSVHSSTLPLWAVSEPDSGYSVDNIPPVAPTGLVGKQSFVPIGMQLTWDMNEDFDLARYAVYRGVGSNFVPGLGNRIATLLEPQYFDSNWRWTGGYYYKVSAIDVHGNESGFALLTPDGMTGTDTPKAPAATYLAQNYPNPFNPMTRIAFGLSAPGHVSLRIYDASGRLVRMLADGNRPAANYAEVWDGKDASGRAVASGIYFCRLDAGPFTQTRKMILLR